MADRSPIEWTGGMTRALFTLAAWHHLYRFNNHPGTGTEGWSLNAGASFIINNADMELLSGLNLVQVANNICVPGSLAGAASLTPLGKTVVTHMIAAMREALATIKDIAMEFPNPAPTHASTAGAAPAAIPPHVGPPGGGRDLSPRETER